MGSLTICSSLSSSAETSERTLLRSAGVAVSSRTKEGSRDSIRSNAKTVLALCPSSAIMSGLSRQITSNSENVTPACYCFPIQSSIDMWFLF
jgi:hypothetical protein